VKQCEQACSTDSHNPLLALDQEEFKNLFAHQGDAGFTSHFALFGCNAWNRSGTDCRGYDAFYADPANCPTDDKYQAADAGATQVRCKQYAGAIYSELGKFVKEQANARYMIQIGTASRTGNKTDSYGAVTMHPDNIKLALERAAQVGEARGKIANKEEVTVNAKTYSVILDNTRLFFDDTAFREILKKQLRQSSGVVRGFTPTADAAMNRSVLLLAISCDLSAEGVL